MKRIYEVKFDKLPDSKRRYGQSTRGIANSFSDAKVKALANCPVDMYVSEIRQIRRYDPSGQELPRAWWLPLRH